MKVHVNRLGAGLV